MLEKVSTYMSTWFRFTLAVLATWRVTHLLASEDGPADLIVRFRVFLGESVMGKLIDCFYCLSLWIGAPAALFVSRDPVEWLVSWLATSGGACLLERAFGKKEEENEVAVIEPLVATAEEGQVQGDRNHVLRTETVVTRKSRSEEPGVEEFRGAELSSAAFSRSSACASAGFTGSWR